MAKAGVAGLEGRWGVVVGRGHLLAAGAPGTPPGDDPAFAVGARPPVGRGAAALQTRAVWSRKEETVLRSQRRRRGQPARGFFADAVMAPGGEGGEARAGRGGRAPAATGCGDVAQLRCQVFRPQPAEALLPQWGGGAGSGSGFPPCPAPVAECSHGNGGPDYASSARSRASRGRAVAMVLARRPGHGFL